jgi:hypothetical protein
MLWTGCSPIRFWESESVVSYFLPDIPVPQQDAFLQMSFYCPFGGGDLEMLLAPPPEKKDPSKLVVFMASNCANGGKE